jgi:Uncharacterized protein conserved in archaea (DUF2226)
MMFPKGEVRHQNLLTAYTDVAALLSALKSEGFSGIVEIEFPEKGGAIFIDSGEILNAEIKGKADGDRKIGQEAVQAFLSFSNQKNGVLNVYQLLPEHVALVTSHLQYEVLFKELSTDYTRLDRLLFKLKEDKHDGFIEILTKERKALGVLFVEGGEPVEMFTLPESGPSVFGRKSIPLFVENVSKQGGAILNVCRSWSKIPKKERPAPESKPAPEGKSVPESKPISENKSVGGGKEGLKEIIPILQETLSNTERLVDGASRNGTFIGTFKKCLIEKAEAYSFLDPFAGEFEYQDGVIRFSGEAGEKEFAKGILECLSTTLMLLEKELPKNKMRSLKLGAEIRSSLEPHGDTLRRLGLTEVFSSSLR